MLRGCEPCVVAFSGGVDSTVVAKAAQLALGDAALAVTGVSSSLASGELDEARRLATLIGIRHEVIETREFEQPAYLQNAPDRCYHCKTELYTQLDGLVERYPGATIVNGANLDDRGDYRPGHDGGPRACGSQSVDRMRTDEGRCSRLGRPLGVARLGQAGEPVPQQPHCVRRRGDARADRDDRSRRAVPALERPARGARALPQGDLARLEVPADAIARLTEPALRNELIEQLRSLGFKFITLDLEGFRSGSLNQVIGIQLPKR